MKHVHLHRGNHLFVFRYEEGQEPAVLDALTEAVRRRVAGFDWFDAAMLSHQLGKNLARSLAEQPAKANNSPS